MKALALLLALVGTAEAGVVSASYETPATGYADGVRGDAIEWGAPRMKLGNGRTVRVVLPQAPCSRTSRRGSSTSTLTAS